MQRVAPGLRRSAKGSEKDGWFVGEKFEKEVVEKKTLLKRAGTKCTFMVLVGLGA